MRTSLHSIYHCVWAVDEDDGNDIDIDDGAEANGFDAIRRVQSRISLLISTAAILTVSHRLFDYHNHQ